MEKKIIIPNIELMSDDEYDTVINILESMPVDYEIWEQKQ